MQGVPPAAWWALMNHHRVPCGASAAVCLSASCRCVCASSVGRREDGFQGAGTCLLGLRQCHRARRLAPCRRLSGLGSPVSVHGPRGRWQRTSRSRILERGAWGQPPSARQPMTGLELSITVAESILPLQHGRPRGSGGTLDHISCAGAVSDRVVGAGTRGSGF